MPESLQNVLNFVVGIVAAIIIIALVVFIVKDVISFIKGQGTSLFSILGKIGAVLVIVALLIVAKGFYNKGDDLSTTVNTLTDSVVNDMNGINSAE
jgi:hypothetical protein